MQLRLLLLLVSLSAFATGAAALTTDRVKPVRIDADWAHFDDRKRIATYKGNVAIIQGSLRVSGALIVMHFDESYDLAKIVAEGNPAHFEQRLDRGPLQQGQAARIEYSVADGAMLFAGDARIVQDQFEMKASRIDYDSVTGSIEGAAAESEDGGTQRVTILLQGKQE